MAPIKAPPGQVASVALTDGKGNVLDRVRQFFNRGNTQLGPGLPVDPVLQQDPSEEGAPRVFQYPVSSNTMQTPRGEGGANLTSFEQLRALAANYDIAQLCHQALCQELGALEWDVVPAKRVEKHDTAARDKLQPRADKVREFLLKPDGELSMSQWSQMLLREDLEIGAPAIYKKPTRGKGLYALEIIQGDLIKPLIDYRGKVVAYQQNYRGVVLNTWPASSFIYAPRIRRRNSVYGMSPLELVLLNVNSALRRETFELAYYTDGNIPDALAGVPDTWTPEQIAKFQEWFDVLFSGDDSQRRKMRFWPGDPSKIYQFAKKEETIDHMLWTLLVTCAIHSVNPEEIGFTHLAKGKSTSGTQAKATERKGITPIALWLEGIITDVIQQELGEPELRFKYILNEEEEDALQSAQADEIYINTGVYDASYVRDRKGVPAQYAPKDPVLPSGSMALQMQQGANNQNNDNPPNTSPDGSKADKKPAPGQGGGDQKQAAVQKAMQDDLRRWREKAVGRVKLGKSAECAFASEHIPADQAERVRLLLSAAETADDVRAVFQGAL
jgi:hypothetical protein